MATCPANSLVQPKHAQSQSLSRSLPSPLPMEMLLSTLLPLSAVVFFLPFFLLDLPFFGFCVFASELFGSFVSFSLSLSKMAPNWQSYTTSSQNVLGSAW